MYDNEDIKDTIKKLLDEGRNDDAVSLFKNYSIEYRSNEKQSRKVTMSHVAALLSVSLRNSSSKIISDKLNKCIEDIKNIAKM